jgi:cardiolipin synthase (CMP-forming)
MIEPIMVCDELAGRPSHQVPTFQMTAAINSAKIIAKPALPLRELQTLDSPGYTLITPRLSGGAGPTIAIWLQLHWSTRLLRRYRQHPSRTPVLSATLRGMLTDLPNLLTLSRIAAIPLLVVLVALHQPPADMAACVLFSTAAITDYFDGHFARTRRQQSDLGRMLDPIADKLLVGAALMMLVGLGRVSNWGLYPAIVIMLREILVSGLREYLAGIRIGLPVTRLAKWKTGFQMGALGTLLAGDSSAQWLHLSFIPVGAIGEIMLWAAAALTLWTGWDYLTAGLRHASGVRAPGSGLTNRQMP